MRKKSAKAIGFIDGLHEYIIKNPQFRRDTRTKSEAAIQAELRPLIIRYLEDYFARLGVKDSVARANKAFYWEGQEGQFGKARSPTFGSRNYPDFIVTEPYKLAVEYKQSPSGSVVKHGIGQSLMHTLSGDFDFAYLLFHDESPDKRIEKSRNGASEAYILERMWSDFNVLVKFV